MRFQQLRYNTINKGIKLINHINNIEGFTFNGLELYVSYDLDKRQKPTVKIGDKRMGLKDFQEFLLTAYEFCPELFSDLPIKDK